MVGGGFSELFRVRFVFLFLEKELPMLRFCQFNTALLNYICLLTNTFIRNRTYLTVILDSINNPHLNMRIFKSFKCFKTLM